MKNWKLVFEDHFDGDKLDESVWTKEVGMLRKAEPQYFTNEDRNCFVKDSCLFIRTIKEKYEGAEYTSASIITGQKKEWMYGRIEMRAKLPRSRSLWPAFWTLGSNFYNGVDWPQCGEIDIMEMVGGPDKRDNTTISTVHWLAASTNAHDECGGYNGGTYTYDKPLCEDFHIYAVEWDAEKMTFFFNDRVVYECIITPDMQGAFNQPHYIILNTSLENWDWDPSHQPGEDTDLPQDYIIDYVRVYQEEK